jgi:hypothetical protein
VTAAKWPRPAVAALLIAVFAYFSYDALRVRFAPDDLMNLGHYCQLSTGRLLAEFVAPWLGGYRPMGALYYLPLLKTFGLHPAPYHAVMLLVLLANAFLLYRLARALGCAETTAAIAALLACYHPGLSFLYFNTSFIYDALCAFFYLAAVGYYIGIRAGGRRLSPGQLALFLLLDYCALQSKEMAFTMPAVLLAYEVVVQKERQYAGFILTAALNVPFLYGVLFSPNPLAGLSIYRPQLSAGRILAFQRDAFADLFVSWHTFNVAWVLAIWAILTVLAWRPRRPVLRFAWCWWLLTPIPLELLEGRTNACLAIPFCGLAIFAAAIFTEFADRIPVSRTARAAILAAGVLAWTLHADHLKRSLIRPQMRELGQETWAVIDQFNRVRPRVRPNSTVVFLNDPFDGFDMAFIAELWFRQPNLNIRLHRKTPFTPEELAKADHLFTFEQGKLLQIR